MRRNPVYYAYFTQLNFSFADLNPKWRSRVEIQADAGGYVELVVAPESWKSEVRVGSLKFEVWSKGNWKEF